MRTAIKDTSFFLDKIAPHLGEELTLVITGRKPFAVVERTKDPALFEQVLSMGDHLDARIHFANEIAYTLKTEDSCKYHTKYLSLLRSLTTKDMSRREYQKQMGKLFGYSDEAIQTFIDNPPECNCKHCGGTLV